MRSTRSTSKVATPQILVLRVLPVLLVLLVLL